jgi:hypothetical protein
MGGEEVEKPHRGALAGGGDKRRNGSARCQNSADKIAIFVCKNPFLSVV